MSDRISGRIICKSCKEHHRYNPEAGSTYSSPREGGFLCSVCPQCGSMLPLLGVVVDNTQAGYDLETISKNGKRRLARQLAKVYGLDPRLVLDISRVLWDVEEKKDYVSMLAGLLSTAFNIKLTGEQVRSVLE